MRTRVRARSHTHTHTHARTHARAQHDEGRTSIKEVLQDLFPSERGALIEGLAYEYDFDILCLLETRTKDHHAQAECIPHPHNTEDCWEAHGTHCCQETRQRPRGQGEFRPGKSTWENTAAFAYDVYEGFQRKEQTVAVAINLEDAYNRVQFKLLMDLLIQHGVNLTLTQWFAGALLERTVIVQLWNWSSAPHQLTMGLPQGSLL